MQELIVNIHIHSKYSDGVKTPPEIARDAARCGVDVIILTDHNVFPRGFDGYYSYKDKKVLLITGEEIHDQTRYPQKNHLLALGIHRDFSRLAKNPQELINAINQASGASFIAHAYDPALPMFDEADLSWVDWNIKGFSGFEVWNNLSEFKLRVKNKWQAIFFAFFPAFMALEPPKQIREKWDSFLSDGQRVFGIGGADAHTLQYPVGPFTKNVFPYTYHFRAINTHVLLDSDLSGDVDNDSRKIIEALRQGHSFIGYDLVRPTRGFRFSLLDQNSMMPSGGCAVINNKQKLIARLPCPAECRLIKNGQIIDRKQVKDAYTFKIKEAGAYRLECYRWFLGKKRGWVFSNPIFIDPG